MEESKISTEIVLKAIDIHQALITRMSKASSTVKNWCITVNTALIIFAADKNQWPFLILAIIPSALFAALDTYYLFLEKEFRENYKNKIEAIAKNTITIEDLLIVESPKITYCGLRKAFVSPSIRLFYLLFLAFLIAASVILFLS